MSVDAEQLNIILAARDREFSRAMERNQRRVERFSRQSQKHLSKTSKSFSSLAGAARGLLPAIGAAALIGSVKRVVSNLDEIGKKADQIGLSTSALQELRVVAESAGVAQASLDSSLERFSKRLGEARFGMGAVRVALDELNLSAADLTEMGIDKSLSVIADEMKAIEDPTRRAALAAALFGREGVAMVNLLREGSAGMEEMRREARDLGVVIDESIIRQAEGAQNKLDLMSRVISANLSVALIELAPLLVSSAEGIAYITNAVSAFASIVATIPTFGGTSLNTGEDVAEVEKLMDAVERFPEAGKKLDALVGNLDTARSSFGQTSSEFAKAATELKTAQNQLLKRAVDTEINDGNVPKNIMAFITATNQQIAAKNEIARVSGLSADAIARENIVKEKSLIIDNFMAEAERANLDISDKVLESILKKADAYEESALAALEAGKATTKASGGTKKLSESMIEAQEAAARFKARLVDLGGTVEDLDSLGGSVQSSMENAFDSMGENAKDAEKAVLTMLQNVIKELYHVLVVQQLVGQLKTGGGGILGAIAPFVGKASGGPVQQGRPVTVGEHGRELFVPREAGRILTGPQAQSAVSGGGGVVIHQTNNFAQDMSTIARAEIASALPQITKASMAAVSDARRRGAAV